LKNFFVLFFALCTCASVQAAPLPEVERSTIEYKSPAEALEALRSKPGVEISVQGGWTIAYEPALHVIWSFAPKRHASYPSVVKRSIVEKDGTVFVKMDVKCKASKDVCDDLVREFIQLNEAMRSSFQLEGSREK
jgi:hypothetical protein